MPKKAVSLIEILIVVVVIGILATLGYVNYTPIREDALDREARANLELVMAAQRIYRMETSFYFDSAGTPEGQILNINEVLKLSLTSAGDRNWNFITDADNTPPGDTACVQAIRTSDGRTWVIRNDDILQPGDTCP